MSIDFDSDFRRFGYLGSAIQEMIPGVRRAAASWFQLALQANQALQAITFRAVDEQNGHSAERGVVGTYLLLRSASAFQGTILLLERGMIVEARTLIRGLVENALCLGALHSSPDEFLKMLETDNRGARKAQAKLIQKFGFSKGHDAEKAISEIAEQADKAPMLNFAEVAKLSPLTEVYLLYRVLSNDSAHPSADSLERYMEMNEEKSGWSYTPGIGGLDEISESFADLFLAMTAAAIAFTDMVSDKTGNHDMAEISSAWRALSKASGT